MTITYVNETPEEGSRIMGVFKDVLSVQVVDKGKGPVYISIILNSENCYSFPVGGTANAEKIMKKISSSIETNKHIVITTSSWDNRVIITELSSMI